MTEIINNQRKIKLDWQIYKDFAESVIRSTPEAGNKSVTIGLVSDRKMRELNKQFRGKNSTTDVLSFPYETDEFETNNQNLGDIIISLEQAARQAEENDLTLETEIKQLILHGVLHLCGYDHETDAGEMNAKELKHRVKLGI
jgi:probable rRNA maturation factor